MKTFYSFFFVMIAAIISTSLFSQNTFPSSGAAGIGTTSPAASSLLEVKSTSKGVLISRMTKNQRNAITSPATGLLIYQTDATPGFYYYSGIAWKAVTVIDTTLANKTLSNLTSPTAVSASLVPGSDNKYNIGSSSKKWKNMYLYNLNFNDGSLQTTAFIPYSAGTGISISGGMITNTKTTQWSKSGNNIIYSSGDALIHGVTVGKGSGSVAYNTATGSSALYSNTTGQGNTANGFWALYYNTTGYQNTANGSFALSYNTTGCQNTASGYFALYYNTTGLKNSAFGCYALYVNSGSFNTATGYGALYYNGTGSNNTATGYGALYNNSTGNNNVANGFSALYSNTTGYSNIAIGDHALFSNTDESNNVAIGDSALYNNGLGKVYLGQAALNTAVGSKALFSNTTGLQNTANGLEALYFNTTGVANTALGYRAIRENSSGDDNTAIGYTALFSNTSGNANTAMGYGANVSEGNLLNATAIGNEALVNASNKVRIGDENVTVVESQVGSWTTSDGRFKNNIKENVKGLEFIKLLRPVTYNFDTKKFQEFLMQNYPDSIKQKRLAGMDKDATAKASGIIQSGFIAQEVEDAVKKSGYNFNGVHAPENPTDNWSLSYEKLTVPLVKAVQELSKMNDAKDSAINAMKDDYDAKINTLQNQINALKAMMVSNRSTVNGQPSTVISSASFQQNIPNPFNHTTSISYTLPQIYSSAKIIVTDKSGKMLKEVTLSANGKGSVNIDASTLASGAYQYSLIVDGRMIDTKQMILTK